MKTFVLNTLGIGMDTTELINDKINISGVIGLSDRSSSDKISDFVYLKDFCSNNNLAFIEVTSYGLSNESDKRILLDLEIDVLVVVGWQRLIPDWLIRHCKIAVIGVHGSPLGITKGRGRSPQNWALLLGLKDFYISIFKIDAGIDSGSIIDTRYFSYSEFDDIKTSYYKASILTSIMIVDCLKKNKLMNQEFKEQNHSEAEYFPQRVPDDGLIDWDRPSDEIRNFVRALTRPYPGAETIIDGTRIKIWSVLPFDLDIDIEDSVTPGFIYKIFNKNDILVRTANSFLLINDYEIDDKMVSLKKGMKFESVSFRSQLRSIVNRHKVKFPDLQVSSIFNDLI